VLSLKLLFNQNLKLIRFSEDKPNEINLKACYECIKEGLKTFFVPEGAKLETVVQSEPKASSSKAKIISKPKNSKPKVMINSDSETSKIKILKRSEPVPQSLLKSESGVLKSKCQKNKTVVASWELKAKGIVTPILNVSRKFSMRIIFSTGYIQVYNISSTNEYSIQRNAFVQSTIQYYTSKYVKYILKVHDILQRLRTSSC